ncbi:hypothetical protein [Streptomyces sp. NPDC047981]|uniref:hypothetical protein n=1 Tax=Streptomyces sp. NPDC047981 TaxID=3154610 RepID=UPI00343822AC
MTSWVPDSCTLPTGEQPLRVAEFDTLFAAHLTDLARPGPHRLRLAFARSEGVEETVRDLVARESGCCSFFRFAITPGPEQIRLDISVDSPHEAVLDALQERAAGLGRTPAAHNGQRPWRTRPAREEGGLGVPAR